MVTALSKQAKWQTSWWNQNPLSVYAKPLRVYIDGALRFERNNPELSPESDFELGQLQERHNEIVVYF